MDVPNFIFEVEDRRAFGKPSLTNENSRWVSKKAGSGYLTVMHKSSHIINSSGPFGQ